MMKTSIIWRRRSNNTKDSRKSISPLTLTTSNTNKRGSKFLRSLAGLRIGSKALGLFGQSIKSGTGNDWWQKNQINRSFWRLFDCFIYFSVCFLIKRNSSFNNIQYTGVNIELRPKKRLVWHYWSFHSS